MTPLVKALLAGALVVPLVAYVVGSLAGSGGETPDQQGTVFIDDVEPASEKTSPTRDNQPTQAPRDDDPDDPDDKKARVVTPAPVEDDDDERDDDQDDDTDDGDDTDD